MTTKVRSTLEATAGLFGGTASIATEAKEALTELATLEDATWNAALEAAAKAAETEAGSCLAGLPGFSSSVGVMSEVEAATLNAFAKTIRSIKRGQPPASARPPCDSCHERPRAAGLSVCDSCAKGIYGRKVTP